MSILRMLVFALLTDFFEQLNLDLLNLEEAVVLLAQEVVDFFVKVPDFQLRFQIHFVIVLRAQTIPCLAAILAHHDDRRLDRR